MRESHAGEIITWIREKKRREVQKNNDIREGWTEVNYDYVAFERRNIGIFSMMLPKDSVLLTEEEKKQRYKPEAMPDIAFEEEAREFFLTLTKLKPDTDSLAEKKEWMAEIKEGYPKAKFYDDDTAETETGKKIPYFIVALEGIGGKILLGLFFLRGGAEVWRGTLQCPIAYRRDWRSIWKQMLSSVLEEETV